MDRNKTGAGFLLRMAVTLLAGLSAAMGEVLAGGKAGGNQAKQTTQLMALINSINTDDTRLSAKMERYLTSAALVVFVSTGSIRDVFGVLQDHKVRGDFIDRVPAQQKENLAEYVASLRELDEYKDVKVKDGGATVSISQLIGTKEHLIRACHMPYF